MIHCWKSFSKDNFSEAHHGLCPSSQAKGTNSTSFLTRKKRSGVSTLGLRRWVYVQRLQIANLQLELDVIWYTGQGTGLGTGLSLARKFGDYFDIATAQGRRRVFKSSPAEETIKCRRHEKGESTRGGIITLSLGGFGGLPLDFFWILSASMCVFNVYFMRLGTDFSHDFLLDNIWNQTIFFIFFFSMFLWHYFTYVHAGFGKVL